MAIAAFVAGLVSVPLFFLFAPALAALVLAFVAWRRIKRGAGTLTGRALAGIGGALAVLSVLGGVLLWAVVVNSHVFEGHLTSYADLRPGDCFEAPTSFIRLYRVVPCTHAHDREVVGRVIDPAGSGAAYPGTTALTTEGAQRCPAQVFSYLGVPLDRTRYLPTFYYPRQAAWDTGERAIVCVVGNLDGTKMVGSLRSGPLA